MNQEDTFSTTESAVILNESVERVRTWLRRAPRLLIGQQEAPGSWRLLTKDTLLRLKTMAILMRQGLEMEQAAQIVSEVPTRLSFGDDFVWLSIPIMDDAHMQFQSSKLLTIQQEEKEHLRLSGIGAQGSIRIDYGRIKRGLYLRIEEFTKGC
jgi:hypothetical protein